MASQAHSPQLSSCVNRLDLEREDLIGNWLENGLSGTGLEVHPRTGFMVVF